MCTRLIAATEKITLLLSVHEYLFPSVEIIIQNTYLC